jgi:hypothetical protein
LGFSKKIPSRKPGVSLSTHIIKDLGDTCADIFGTRDNMKTLEAVRGLYLISSIILQNSSKQAQDFKNYNL